MLLCVYPWLMNSTLLLSVMVVLFNRTCNFGRDALEVMKEVGYTRLASQISRNHPGNQWCDRYRNQITLISMLLFWTTRSASLEDFFIWTTGGPAANRSVQTILCPVWKSLIHLQSPLLFHYFYDLFTTFACHFVPLGPLKMLMEQNFIKCIFKITFLKIKNQS